MKTYKLQKESSSSLAFAACISCMLVFSSIYALITIEYKLPVFIFLSLLSIVFLAMFVSTLKEIEDKSEQFLEVKIDDDSVSFNEKSILFKDVEAFSFEHYIEYGNYHGRIYLVEGGKKNPCLYSREFDGNNYLSEEMMLEIFTRLDAKYELYKKEHPSNEPQVKMQSTQERLWGIFQKIDVPPKSIYFNYNGSYDATMFLLLALALLMLVPAFLVNYSASYFKPELQELLYSIYFLSEYKNYEIYGADVSVIAWGMFYIATLDILFKRQFKILFFMSYDEKPIRVGEVALSLSVLLYVFLLIIYFDGEEIVGFLAITLMMAYMLLLAYLEHKKRDFSPVIFFPLFSLFMINILALGSILFRYLSRWS